MAHLFMSMYVGLLLAGAREGQQRQRPHRHCRSLSTAMVSLTCRNLSIGGRSAKWILHRSRLWQLSERFASRSDTKSHSESSGIFPSLRDRPTPFFHAVSSRDPQVGCSGASSEYRVYLSIRDTRLPAQWLYEKLLQMQQSLWLQSLSQSAASLQP